MGNGVRWVEIRVGLVLALLGLVLSLGVMVRPAQGFVVEGPRDGAVDALDHLRRAPRWALTAGSLAATGERGLGGGLEYVLDDSLCALEFIDASSCADIKASVREAFAMWADGHGLLRFVEAPAGTRVGWPLAVAGLSDQGAEIDVMGAGAAEFPLFASRRVKGYTIFYERPAEGLVLTNGQTLPGSVGRLESADVRFSAAQCYYRDVERARADCVHFPSLALHEIGHALGIDHPEEKALFNLDTNTDPNDRLVVDCRNPEAGLRASPAIQPAAVAIGQDVQGPGRWKRGLTWDDVAARDALYPHCGTLVRERGFQAWGAFALSEDFERSGQGQGASAPEEAERMALAACGPACRVVSRFEGCFAFARGRAGQSGMGRAASSAHARVDAVLACSERDTNCTVTTSFCAFE